MQKIKLNKFIQKYNLGGNVNSVKWTSKDNKLSTTFVTPDKSLMGKVSVDNFKFDEGYVGIYTTDQLEKLLNVLSGDITLDVSRSGDKAYLLKIKDGLVSIDYTLSDLSVIPDPPTLKRVPDFETNIKVDSNFIGTFIKGKSALPDADTFTIVNKNGDTQVIIGYSTINTNRVNIPVSTTINGLLDNISFNANLFKDILVANKDCTSATLEVSNDGLIRINFKIDDYDSVYYIVATQGNI
tara:strand:- start:2695 stop:3414 length:720 start_codon:yes stop_codon:yes gene_type:complete